MADEAGGLVKFAVGDVVEGRFSARPQSTERAIVRGIVGFEFHGDLIDYVENSGYGTWGYARQVVSVRPANEDDESRAARVKARVSQDTENALTRMRA
jgi:hypothetical protein